jgi:hypothetical protein
MMLKTRIVIEIGTNFSRIIDQGDDVTKWTEEKFHDSIHDVFEDFMARDDDFEHMVLDRMSEEPHMKAVNEFGQLGGVGITMSNIQTLQAFTPPPEHELSKDQRLLTEFAVT